MRWQLAIALWWLLGCSVAAAQPLISADEARLIGLLEQLRSAPEAAEAEARAWLEDARRQGNPAAEAHARDAIGAVLRWRGRFDLAAVEFAAALEIAERLDDRRLIARAAADLAIAFGMAGLHADALVANQQAIEAYRQLQDWPRLSGVLANMGNHLAESGNLDAAREHYLQALEMKRQHGIERGVGTAQINLADLEMQAGRTAAAIDLLQQAARAAAATADAEAESIARGNLAHALAQAGRFGEAEQQLQAAAAALPPVAARAEAALHEARARVLLLRAQSLGGDEGHGLLPQALQAVQLAQAVAQRMDDPARRADLAELASAIHGELGDWRAALLAEREAAAHTSEQARRLGGERHAVLTARYSNERRERELAELRSRETAQRAELGAQRLLAGMLGLAVLVVVGVALALWRNVRQRRRNSRALKAHVSALERALGDAERNRQRAEQLAAQNAQLLSLAGNDLRAPLLQIRNAAERMLVDHASDLTLARQVAAIAQAASELIRTSEQMVETGSLPPVPLQVRVPVDVVALVKTVVTDAQTRVQGRRCLIEVDLAEPCQASVDGARLQLVLHELVQLVLAVNAGVERLGLRVQREGEWVLVGIDDPRGLLQAKLAGERQLPGSGEAAAGNLGLLWISGTLEALGGELTFVAPVQGLSGQVVLRVPAFA